MLHGFFSGWALPGRRLSSKTLHKYFDSVLQITTNAGLNVVGVSMDNYSANRKFYTELYGGELKSFIASPVDKNKPLFLLFDTVHNFKNIYNNFLAKNNLSAHQSWILPSVIQNFATLKEST